MKKSLITTLVATPLLSLSSLAFAADPAAAEPVLLSASQMDGITAGAPEKAAGGDNTAAIGQLNVSPVTVVQVNVLSVGSSNAADIVSGNFAAAFQ